LSSSFSPLSHKDDQSVNSHLMAEAVRDRDAALDALVVLDSQRLEMLALCDKTAMALLLAASELKPLIERAAAEMMDRDAGRLASRSGAFNEEIERLLSEALAETKGDSSSQSSGVKAVYTFVRYLANRMQFFAKDALRAVPEPANLDTMIRQSQSTALRSIALDDEVEDLKSFKRPNTEHSSSRRSNYSEEKKEEAILPSLPSLPRAALTAAASRRDKKSASEASSNVTTEVILQPKYNAYIHEGSGPITANSFERAFPFERPVLVPRGRLSPSKES